MVEVLGKDVSVRGDPRISLLRLPQPSTTNWGLKQQKFMSPQSRRLEAHRQGVGRVGFS